MLNKRMYVTVAEYDEEFFTVTGKIVFDNNGTNYSQESAKDCTNSTKIHLMHLSLIN